MKAFILAAGLGTRLRPWTLSHPKALVPVGGVPMLERVIVSLKKQGFDYIVVNVHHFANQIIDFLASHDFGVKVYVSDEQSMLLDTGGAILHAAHLLANDREPFLVHNVDILSNADLSKLMHAHQSNRADATLLVSDRDSSRRLVFDNTMQLRGWHNIVSGQVKPPMFSLSSDMREFSFSGIHAVSPSVVDKMRGDNMKEAFPIIDYYLDSIDDLSVMGLRDENLKLIDIGKPATLSQADSIFSDKAYSL